MSDQRQSVTYLAAGYNPLSCRRLGRTSLTVTPLCIGGGPLGSMPENFGYTVDEWRAVDTVRHVFDGPINFLDTSNGYSGGESERRIGLVVAERGALPPGFVLATKVDRDPVTGDFSAEQVRRSAEQSLARLHLDRFQLIYIHDPEHVGFEAAMAPGGAVEGTIALKESGLAEYIGVAGGPVGMLTKFVRTGLFDALITHNRLTLVDRSADELVDEAVVAGVAVVNAAPYGGGILAKGPGYTDRYAYRRASPTVLQRIREMERICDQFDTTLRSAALHVSLRDPRVASTIVGTATRGHVDELVAMATDPPPEGLWAELAPLVAPHDEWLR